MTAFGLALLAFSLIALWICLPDKLGAKKRFLRGGLDIVATIVIASSFVIGIVVVTAGLSPGPAGGFSLGGSSRSAATTSTSSAPR